MTAHGTDPQTAPSLDQSAPYRGSTPRPAPPARDAPPRRPNVVVVMLDDMGFGASSALGGSCAMPAAERLAAGGLTYTRFHTAGVCSPTRAALLTGRNHHAVGMGHIPELATEAVSYNARIPRSAATLAKVLQRAGYATGAFGKMHETPTEDVTPVGPYEQWPTSQGFERFYGFLGGASDQWRPTLYEGTTPVDPPRTPEEGYHLSEDMIDQALHWVTDLTASRPDDPFFCYLPFGATHTPFHVTREWVEPYRGAFDHGWDEERRRVLERQIARGIAPAGTRLAPWPDEVPSWDELSAVEQRAAAILQELYAGFATHTDAQVGRFVDGLEARGLLDDTLFIYILGDNGASTEGGLRGTTDAHLNWNGIPQDPEEIVAAEHELGGPETWPNYPVGWALAMCTPFPWAKQIVSHYGATRNGMIVHWPRGIAARGEIRDQWHHVVDVFPTVLDAAGVGAPAVVDGVAQQPVAGKSMVYTFTAPEDPSAREVQYFEIAGARGVYWDGWVACTRHERVPWEYYATAPALEDDRWELYDTRRDWSESRDVAEQHPQRLRVMKELFLAEAARNAVLPIDDRPPALRRATGRAPILRRTFRGHARGVPYDLVPNITNRSHRVVAEVVVDDAAGSGVICAQGGRFGGWALYVREGVLTYAHNVARRYVTQLRAGWAWRPGRHTVEFRFRYDGEGFALGADGELLVDGTGVGGGRIERSTSFLFPTGESFSIGSDWITPVVPDYTIEESAFPGTVESLTIALDPADRASGP
jgi:arylsulfatase